MHDAQIEEFFASARERYEIFLRKDRGEPDPLTEDEAFRSWRFCNVFREDDKVTRWIRTHVRDPLRREEGITTAMTACRFFNRIDTLQILLDGGLLQRGSIWDPERAQELLQDHRPVVGAAYVVKTPDGMDKLRGVIAIVELVREAERALESKTYDALENLHTEFRRIPFFGNFMAYEVVSDLRHTWVGEDAKDILTWAFPGPGAARGMSWLVSKDLTSVKYGAKRDRLRMLHTMQHLLMIAQRVEWPRRWPKWEMREVEHWLCEYAKYVKVKHLGMRMKVKYP